MPATNPTPSDTPSPSVPTPRRAASSSAAKKAVTKASEAALPRAGGRPAFARKNPAAYRGGRVRDRKVEPTEELPAEKQKIEAVEPAEIELPKAGPSEGPSESRDPVADAPPPREDSGVRQEHSPNPQREPRRDQRPQDRDQRQYDREQRPHDRDQRPYDRDRGPRPNRTERSDRADRWDRPPAPRPERPSFDLRELSDKAWQLFSAELREEGVTFVDDTDAEKLTNRCFKLAEVFIRQRQRRLSSAPGSSSPEERRRDEPRPTQSQPSRQELPAEEPQIDLSNEEDGD